MWNKILPLMFLILLMEIMLSKEEESTVLLLLLSSMHQSLLPTLLPKELVLLSSSILSHYKGVYITEKRAVKEQMTLLNCKFTKNKKDNIYCSDGILLFYLCNIVAYANWSPHISETVCTSSCKTLSPKEGAIPCGKASKFYFLFEF
jgi:hypothetical protein